MQHKANHWGGGMRSRLKGLSATHSTLAYTTFPAHVAEAKMENQVSNCDSE